MPKNRIDLRGVIVPSNYDMEFFQDYIAKGLFTPESTFRARLAKAATNQPLEIYVNSPGGSVFAGNEMANAVRDWKVTNKQPVQITLGAMAASSAAAFTINVADKIVAHKNALVMFHGAITVSIGGADMHGDTKALLDKINDNIKTCLVSDYGIPKATVDTWFAEGREGWLTCQEMQTCGMVDEVIGEDAETIQFPDEDINAVANRGFGIAAMLNHRPEAAVTPGASQVTEPRATASSPVAGANAPSQGEPQLAPTSAQPAAPAPAPAAAGWAAPAAAGPAVPPVVASAPAASVPTVPSVVSASTPAPVVPASDPLSALRAQHAEELKRRDGLLSAMQSERDKAIAQVTKALTQSADSLAAEKTTSAKTLSDARAAWAKEKDALVQTHATEKAKLTDQVTELHARLDKLLGGALRFSPDMTSWEEALASCNGDYVTAAKQYPELLDAWRKAEARRIRK